MLFFVFLLFEWNIYVCLEIKISFSGTDDVSCVTNIKGCSSFSHAYSKIGEKDGDLVCYFEGSDSGSVIKYVEIGIFFLIYCIFIRCKIEFRFCCCI
jgi:hypothetical protein